MAEWNESDAWRLMEQGDTASAKAMFEALLPSGGGGASVVIGLTECLLRLGEPKEAEQVLRAHPLPDAIVVAQLGYTLQSQGRWAEAEAEYRTALAIDDRLPRARLGLGVVLMKQNRLAEAQEILEYQVHNFPGDGHAWLYLASVYRTFGHMTQAFAAYRRGLAILPERDPIAIACHWELALTALALGDYATGFAEFEWRLESLMGEHVAAMKALAPPWEGVVARGRSILLWFEQGLGDVIHFSRYAQMLGQMGMAVHLWVQPALARLMRTLPDVQGVHVAGDAIPVVDCQASLLSVPHLLRIGGRGLSIPRTVPYLFPDAAEVTLWRQRIDGAAQGRRKVGLVWAGNPGFGLDYRRTLAFEALAPIFQVPGNAFFALQMGVGRASAEQLAQWGVVDLADQIGDYADTAAAMVALDLIISVDTSTVHCAGALGRPAWLPLYSPPDWRWGLTGDETIWYPSIRQFRQSVRGEWGEVITRMAEALRTLETPS